MASSDGSRYHTPKEPTNREIRRLRPVLVVAYYYPPSGGAGVQRTLKLTRYLPVHGWAPHVLVPDGADYPIEDPSLLREIPPDVTVHRARILEPYGVYRRLTGRRGAGSLDVATLSRDAAERARWGERLAEWIRSTFFIPDARAGWYPFASRSARRIARAVGAEVVYSTAPPYTPHLIGRNAARSLGIGWVADFRDSWVDWLSAAKRTGLSRRIELGMERRVLEDATRIVTVSGGVADHLASRHPEIRDERWRVVPNGFDPTDFAGIEPDRAGVSQDRLLLTHTGTLYGPRDPDTLVEAIEALFEARDPLASSVAVHFVGRVADPIRRRIESGPARDAFRFTGYVDHARAAALGAGSDVLLLVVDRVPESSGILTGKLFEYLGLGRPILALAPEGEAAALVRSTGSGRVVSPGDTKAMIDALRAFAAAARAGTLAGADARAVAPYTRQRQAEAMAGILTEAAARGRR